MDPDFDENSNAYDSVLNFSACGFIPFGMGLENSGAEVSPSYNVITASLMTAFRVPSGDMADRGKELPFIF